MITVILAGAIAACITVLLPALGELLTERAGITNLGTEGGVLAGALTGVVVGISTGSQLFGVLAGVVAGAIVAAVFSLTVVVGRASQLASGLIVWFLLYGLTSMIGRSYNGRVLDPIGAWAVPGLSEIPFVGEIVFDQSPIVYVAYVLTAAVWWFLARTRAGLLIRATGERPAVVAAAGGNPRMIQIITTTVGGAFAGLGGAALSVGQVGDWSTNMTNGYGFIAVAVVLFSGWRVGWAAIGALLFGAAIVTATELQARGFAVNQYLLDALPYLLTLIVLIVISARRTSTPEALGAALAQH